jgi:S-adenosylmethionine/arginine decarboxylase-like enzyme
MEKFVPFHTHLIATMTLNKPPRNVSIVDNWLRRLVSSVDMEILSGPHVCHCADPGNEGITGIVVLSTSHASVHFWSEVDIPYVQMDLYSCKRFDTKIVMDMLSEFGMVDMVNFHHIDRNLPDF